MVHHDDLLTWYLDSGKAYCNEKVLRVLSIEDKDGPQGGWIRVKVDGIRGESCLTHTTSQCAELLGPNNLKENFSSGKHEIFTRIACILGHKLNPK